MSESKVPQLRFKGFSGEWEDENIGNVAYITAGGTPSTANVLYWNPKQIPWMSSGEINKKRLFSTDNQISEFGLNNSSANWIKEKSVLIALAGQGKTRGTVAINYLPLTTNQSVAAIVPKDKLYYEFLYQNLENRYEELRMESSGDGTRGGLNKQIISQISIFIPQISEQTKIGNYFQKLDRLIEQKQTKHQKLKQLKKAMLAKMFPKDGTTLPEVRFKGFSGEWEEKSLNDVSNITIGEFVIKTKQSPNSSYPVYNGGKSYTGFYDEYNNTGNKIIVSARGANAGYVNFEKRNYWAGNSCYSIDFIDKNFYYIDFFYRYIKKNENKFIDYQQAANIPSVSKADMQKFNISFPKVEEQTKIGNYFQKLDKLIDLQLQELEKLKNIKKASLKKMFV